MAREIIEKTITVEKVTCDFCGVEEKTFVDVIFARKIFVKNTVLFIFQN